MSTQPIILSKHADERRVQMGVTLAEIWDALRDPDMVMPGPKTHPPGRTNTVKGKLVVVTDDVTGVVITLLWHRAEGR